MKRWYVAYISLHDILIEIIEWTSVETLKHSDGKTYRRRNYNGSNSRASIIHQPVHFTVDCVNDSTYVAEIPSQNWYRIINIGLDENSQVWPYKRSPIIHSIYFSALLDKDWYLSVNGPRLFRMKGLFLCPYVINTLKYFYVSLVRETLNRI